MGAEHTSFNFLLWKGMVDMEGYFKISVCTVQWPVSVLNRVNHDSAYMFGDNDFIMKLAYLSDLF
jgi:hypothetical protein